MVKLPTPQEQLHQQKLHEIKKELFSGPKTWTQLVENLTMSKPTLSKSLLELQKAGDVERVSIIEGNRSKSVYRLVEAIVKEVPGMFEEPLPWGFPFIIKSPEELDVKQLLVGWFDLDVFQFMHSARKIMSIKNSALPPEKASRYIDEWISQTMRITSEGIGERLKWIAEEGEKSWEKIFGSLEDNPLPLYKALSKFRETTEKAIEKHEEEIARKIESGEIERIDAKDVFAALKSEEKERC